MNSLNVINAPPGKEISNHFNGVSQESVARILGVTRQTINRIYQGRQAITAPLALRLEEVTGMNAEFWLELQMKYELENLRNQVSDNKVIHSVGRGRFKNASVERKYAERIADIRQIESGVPAGVIQKKNAAFDGSHFKIKRRSFSG